MFQVEGMTCGTCNVTVSTATERVPGVRAARADASKGRAWVSFDPSKTTATKIAAAISESGYPATELTSERSGASASAREPARPGGVQAASLEAWQPIDEVFRDCEGGCGARVASQAEGVLTQPGARLGKPSYCPVSGVVFDVTATSPRRGVGDSALYFCCESCAQYFDANSSRILALRGLSGPR
ncbi:MAG TPA: heavy-metal-associated domain-containing protein [Polyangiaceae bacterium]|nr:heavy-metal-associated domain-containing protein [Polyangiaceae bacterium]